MRLGTCIYILPPPPPQFPGRWSATLTLPLDYTVLSLSFNREGSQLLAGGDQITLHHLEAPPHPHLLTVPERAAMGGGGPRARELWRRKLPLPVIHLKFSPDGALFASASEVGVFPLPPSLSLSSDSDQFVHYLNGVHNYIYMYIVCRSS